MSLSNFVNGDARWLPLVDGCVNCVILSPPYWGLRDYEVDGQIGREHDPFEYVANVVKAFRDIRRVLHPRGVAWLVIDDTYYGDSPIRIKGQETFSPNYDRTKTRGRRSAARQAGLKRKDLIGIPWRVALALEADGWWLRCDIIWRKPNAKPEGRLTDRPMREHEYVFLLSKSAKYNFDLAVIDEPMAESSKARLLRGRSDKNKYSNGVPGQGEEVMYKGRDASKEVDVPETRIKRTVWTVSTSTYTGSHFATFPEDLVEPMVLSGSRPGDWVLDPFNGAGTTGLVAVKHGRRYIGLDLNRDFIQQSIERVNGVQMSLL